MSLEDAKSSSVVENIHRNKMSQKDIAVSAKILSEKMGKNQAAKHMGVTIATLYRYLGYDALPEDLKEIIPSVVSRDVMIKLFIAIPQVKRVTDIAYKIQLFDLELQRHYVKILANYPKKHHLKLVQMAKSSMVHQNLSLRLTKKAAKKLKTKSDKNDISPVMMAKLILEKSLK